MAIAGGHFNKSLVPVYREDGSLALDHEEYPRPQTTMEGLAALKPAFPAIADYALDDKGTTYRKLILDKYPDRNGPPNLQPRLSAALPPEEEAKLDWYGFVVDLELDGRAKVLLPSGRSILVSPRNVIAYSMMQHAPQPYRFKSNNLRLQIPNPFTLLPDTRFWRTIRDSTLYKLLRDATFTLRTWARRTIWGDGVRPL